MLLNMLSSFYFQYIEHLPIQSNHQNLIVDDSVNSHNSNNLSAIEPTKEVII